MKTRLTFHRLDRRANLLKACIREMYGFDDKGGGGIDVDAFIKWAENKCIMDLPPFENVLDECPVGTVKGFEKSDHCVRCWQSFLYDSRKDWDPQNDFI